MNGLIFYFKLNIDEKANCMYLRLISNDCVFEK